MKGLLIHDRCSFVKVLLLTTDVVLSRFVIEDRCSFVKVLLKTDVVFVKVYYCRPM